MKKLNQSGFSAVEGLLIIVIVGILGFTGWFVYHSKQTANKSLSDASQAQNNQAIKSSTKSGAQTKQIAKTTDPKVKDVQDQTNLKSLQAFAEAYFAQNNFYPTQANFYSKSWVTQNLKGLNTQALVSASGKQAGQSGGYQYTPGPVNCDNAKTQCMHFTWTAKLSDGSTYTVKDLNQ